MIRVLIVDGSAIVRKLMKTLLDADPEIEVLATAMNAAIAQRKIERFQPDVIMLDVNILESDGVDFLRRLMQHQPLPVVMMSNLAQSGAQVMLEALALGAVDCVSRPEVEVSSEMTNNADDIVDRVKIAAQANLQHAHSSSTMPRSSEPADASPAIDSEVAIIAIGASTGGTEAIKDVICQLPETTPGIVISQHIPGSFSKAFAERLNQSAAINVCEAQDGQPILPGHAYLAPGGRHLRIKRNGKGFRCLIDDGPQVNRHKPSVDVLFKSVAEIAGANAVGVLLTGMGDDGSESLGLMKAAGAFTIAQDEASSVVWGMPGEAVKRGHVSQVVPLQQIAEKILHSVSHHE
ncbi:MAG: chemotaxis response regulator protein-glutamate methylesterase [Gammaproteobacteria bacterium]|nr:chemotaxis response regulator protein-glutamate methylesterase [Gammaproteobacteria bacterium]